MTIRVPEAIVHVGLVDVSHVCTLQLLQLSVDWTWRPSSRTWPWRSSPSVFRCTSAPSWSGQVRSRPTICSQDRRSASRSSHGRRIRRVVRAPPRRHGLHLGPVASASGSRLSSTSNSQSLNQLNFRTAESHIMWYFSSYRVSLRTSYIVDAGWRTV